MLAVDVKNIKKTFTSKQDTVEAVKDVSFQVEQGEIFGLLGPNGAGKSTTILMLTTLLSITKGSASILGIDVETQDKQVREKNRCRFTRYRNRPNSHRSRTLFYHLSIMGLLQGRFRKKN